MEKKRLNTSQLSQQILAQAKNKPLKCELCEEFKELQIHHIDNNPTNSKIANLIILCKNCHLKAHKHCWGKSRKKTNEEKKRLQQEYYLKNRDKILTRQRKHID